MLTEEQLINSPEFKNHIEGKVMLIHNTYHDSKEPYGAFIVGSGVCCTIERLDGKKVEEYQPQESRKEFVHNEFKQRMKQFSNQLTQKQKEAKELINKKTLSKEDMRLLNNYIEWLTQEISSNIPYFAERFQETMDTVVHEAKLELENALQHKISVLGLNELHNQNKLLTNGE